MAALTRSTTDNDHLCNILHRNPLILHSQTRNLSKCKVHPPHPGAGGTGGGRKRPGQAALLRPSHVQVTRSVTGTVSMKWTGCSLRSPTVSAAGPVLLAESSAGGCEGGVCYFLLPSWMTETCQ